MDLIRKNLSAAPSGQGIEFAPAWQEDSPVLVIEVTIAVEGQGKNASVVLKEATLKNVSDTGDVADYRLGWILTYADADKKPEAYWGDFAAPGPIAPSATRKVSETIRLPISALSKVKLVSFFVMDARLSNGRNFHADAEKVALNQYQRVWPKKD